MDHIWSTDDVPLRDREAYWREAVCRTFVTLDVLTQPTDTFTGRLLSTGVGPMTVSTIDADSMDAIRTPAAIAGLRQDDLLLALHVHGAAMGSQDGRTATLAPGDAALFDATRPYRVDFRAPGHFVHVVLQFPRNGLEERLGRVDRLTAKVVDRSTSVGRLATQYLLNVAREAPALQGSHGEKVAANVLDMVALALDPMTDGVNRTLPLVHSAQRFILHHLGDPELSPEAVAAAQHVSVRTLYAAFQKQVGMPVSEWVQAQRFRRIRADLRDPRMRGHTVAAIGQRYGVTSAAYLTRGYRSRFGCLPSEDRLVAAADDGGVVRVDKRGPASRVAIGGI